MVNNLKNCTILLLILLVIFSCKKAERKSLNALELTDLHNYKVKETKMNDSVTKVYGENSEYIIEGLIDLPQLVRASSSYHNKKTSPYKKVRAC
ncbi:hypothetical protein [Chryseobacterium sp.]|uniref:hypothetical protein n=1 Tax=Chryseobacterium sp. TaxID=1871047 RepID=UPI00289E2BFE|nr:hypothetical protein [Chryseobacterium sp.]